MPPTRSSARRPVKTLAMKTPAGGAGSAVVSFARFHGPPILLILCVGIAIRVLFFCTYTPWVCGDTPSYLEVAGILHDGQWNDFSGHRTPGYPLLLYLGLVGLQDPSGVVLLQQALGLATALLIYALAWGQTRSRWAAGGAGLLTVAAINLANMEVMLLSESLAGFEITLLVVSFAYVLRRDDGARPWHWLILGLLSTATILTRPNNIFLIPFGCLIALLMARKRPWFNRLRNVAMFASASAGPVLGWMLFMYSLTGVFGLSTWSGYYFTQKTLDCVSLAPDEFAPIRQVLSRWTSDRCPPGVPLDSRIWYANNELEALPGYRDLPPRRRSIEMSRALSRMGMTLITHHPILYAKEVSRSWLRFWRPQGYGPVSPQTTNDPASPAGGNVVRNVSLQWLLTGIWEIQSPLIGALYIAFLVAMPLAMVLQIARRRLATARFLIFSVIFVFAADLTCALAEYGNGRFALPYQPLMTVALFAAAWQAVDTWRNGLKWKG